MPVIYSKPTVGLEWCHLWEDIYKKKQKTAQQWVQEGWENSWVDTKVEEEEMVEVLPAQEQQMYVLQPSRNPAQVQVDASWRKLRRVQNLFLTVISVLWQQLQLMERISGRNSISGRNCGSWRRRSLFPNCISWRWPTYELGKTVGRAAKSNCCWLSRSPVLLLHLDRSRGVVHEGIPFTCYVLFFPVFNF